MNDEMREENPDVTDAMADAEADMVSMLQDDVDELRAALDVSEARVVELVARPTEAAAAAGDEELQALARTVRNAQRTGHPDAATHLNTLLNALGAL